MIKQLLYIILIFLLFGNIGHSQTSKYNCFFFGRLTDPSEGGGPFTPAKIKLDGTQLYTTPDYLGYFSLTIPFHLLNPKSKFIMEIERGNYQNDTITLHGLNASQVLDFNMQEIEPYLSPGRNSGIVQRCQYDQVMWSDSAVYFIYGFVQENKTKFNLTGINISVTDENNNYIVEPQCCKSSNGFYSYKIPRDKMYGKKCFIKFAQTNFETFTQPLLFKDEYIINTNALLNYSTK